MGHIVDLSKHQGDIDFAKLSKQVDLAIIRVQYGSTTVDSKYKEYVAGCKKHGIPFGHYAYARFVNVNDAKVEAKDFLARADKDALFLVVDVEEVTTRDKNDLVPATQAFIDYLNENGDKKVGLYTGHSFYNDHGMNRVKADFLWIPRYPANDNGQPTGQKPSMKTDIWQYSQCGKVDGIKGYVDLNQLIGDKTLSYFTGGQIKKETVKPIKVISKPKPKVEKSTSTTIYKVVAGDTLWGLSKKYNTSVSELKRLNNLKSDLIRIGQKLKVPKTSSSSAKYYTVKSGDNFTKIASKFGTTISKLASLNPGIKDINKIYVGQKVRVS